MNFGFNDNWVYITRFKITNVLVQNLETIKKRMKGWQLDTFQKSYNHKKNNGISLFKKNLLEKK